MPSSYTSLLGFVQPSVGSLTNQWGSVVNAQLTQLVEDSIASTSTQSITSGDWTLSTDGAGAANQARRAILIATGTPGTTRNIYAPQQSKLYVVINASDSSVVFRGGPSSPTTGVTIASGGIAFLVWNSNSSDFVSAAGAGGANTQIQFNNSGSLGGSSSLTWNGTVLTAPLSTTSSAVTQAEKTATTTIATTAFVDRLRSLTTPTTTSSGGTLVVGDRGSLVSVTAGVTVPASVFAAQDVVTIYNNSASNITITQGASLTLRQVGTSNTGSRTLAQRGLATVVFISATEAVISGGGIT